MINKKFSIKIEHKVFLIILLGILFIFGVNFILADLTNSYDNIFEKSENVEIWANTSIYLEYLDDFIKAYLTLDNGTLLENQRLILKYNDSILNSSFTNSEGFVNFYIEPELFNSETKGSLVFEGDPSKYLNPSYKNFVINNSFLKTNQTLNETNVTFEFENFTCKRFKENVIWSSGYSQDEEGSTNYIVWDISENCNKLGINNCLLMNVTLDIRYLYSSYVDLNFEGKGYVQISEPSLNSCDAPENLIYSKYLSYETLFKEEIKKQKHNLIKNQKENFNESSINKIYGNQNCYSLKLYGSQYLVTDIFEIEYSLCGNFSLENVYEDYKENEFSSGGCCK